MKMYKLNLIRKFSLYIFIQEMHLKMPFGKWRPFCFAFNALIKMAGWLELMVPKSA